MNSNYSGERGEPGDDGRKGEPGNAAGQVIGFIAEKGDAGDIGKELQTLLMHLTIWLFEVRGLSRQFAIFLMIFFIYPRVQVIKAYKVFKVKKADAVLLE